MNKHPLNGTYDMEPEISRLNTIHGELHLTVNDKSGTIESHLERDACPFCGSAECNFDCDYSAAEFLDGDSINNSESEDDVKERLQHNAYLDALESIVLAHACAGIDVTDQRYVEGLNSALEAAGNNL